MDEIIAENGQCVTDEMIAQWEDALENDAWPTGWTNVGEIVEGKLPKSSPNAVTLSVKIPASMRQAVDNEAKSAGKTTSAYVRSILAAALMNNL